MSLLESILELRNTAELVRAAQRESGVGQAVDALAECARDLFGVDVDEGQGQDDSSGSTLIDIVDSPNTICAAACWRLNRARQMLELCRPLK
jgi:hypothetical protein